MAKEAEGLKEQSECFDLGEGKPLCDGAMAGTQPGLPESGAEVGDTSWLPQLLQCLLCWALRSSRLFLAGSISPCQRLQRGKKGINENVSSLPAKQVLSPALNFPSSITSLWN